jgi:hypothetical protein
VWQILARQSFTLGDIASECQLVEATHTLDNRTLGLRINVPAALYKQYPYNASAYAWLQELRESIFEYGIIELPDLPLNRCNHTVAMRHPAEHQYSDNPYLNSFFQSPHQDTPPYPTAFWLGAKRHFAATWVMSVKGLEAFQRLQNAKPACKLETIHRELVPQLLQQQQSLLLNTRPGLLLLDNSESHALYHARTCLFDAVAANPDTLTDTPSYAYNEVGLLHHIDQLDSRRGDTDRDESDLNAVKTFLERERGIAI